jgi:hypothetical protein
MQSTNTTVTTEISINMTQLHNMCLSTVGMFFPDVQNLSQGRRLRRSGAQTAHPCGGVMFYRCTAGCWIPRRVIRVWPHSWDKFFVPSRVSWRGDSLTDDRSTVDLWRAWASRAGSRLKTVLSPVSERTHDTCFPNSWVLVDWNFIAIRAAINSVTNLGTAILMVSG